MMIYTGGDGHAERCNGGSGDLIIAAASSQPSGGLATMQSLDEAGPEGIQKACRPRSLIAPC